MKIAYLTTLALILLLANGCKKDGIAKENEFNKSYKTWLAYKSSNQNTYSYTVVNGSWTGYASSTTISVNNGQIVARTFLATQLYQTSNTHRVDTLEKWQKTSVNINTHGQHAADPLTIDRIYEKARTVWLKADNKTNEIYFEAKNNGILSSCGFVPNGCQDDCFTGITISNISIL